MTYLMTVMIILNFKLRYISLWSSIFCSKVHSFKYDTDFNDKI